MASDAGYVQVQGMEWPDPQVALRLAEKLACGTAPLDQDEMRMCKELAAAYTRLVYLRADACWWAKQIADAATEAR